MHTKNDTIFFEINIFLQRFQTSVTKRHEIELKKTKTNHNTTPKRYFWKEAKKNKRQGLRHNHQDWGKSVITPSTGKFKNTLP